MYNTRVERIDESLVVNGEAYDYVVVATEASAVKHVLHESISPQVFSRVKYHPSSIYLHTDPTLMPSSRSDWRAFNICQENDKDMCMLTAWLNEYYPEANFPVDVFETWNPHHEPENVLKVCHFLRVCHTKDTAEILSEIEQLQGKYGIYYAGAYSIGGMGLLEQAARSGRKVSEMILGSNKGATRRSEQKDRTDSVPVKTPPAKSSKARKQRGGASAEDQFSSPSLQQCNAETVERRLTRSMTKSKRSYR